MNFIGERFFDWEGEEAKLGIERPDTTSSESFAESE